MGYSRRIDLGARVAGEPAEYLDEYITKGQIENYKDAKYEHIQMIPTTEIIIRHSLNKVPAVLVLDYYEQEKIHCEVEVIDRNNVKLKFEYPIIFKAYFN